MPETTPIPDEQSPEGQTPEGQTPEGTAPDVTAPEGAAPESEAPPVDSTLLTPAEDATRELPTEQSSAAQASAAQTGADHPTVELPNEQPTQEVPPTFAGPAYGASAAKPEKKRQANLGMVAAVAIAAILGGAVGGGGVYAIVASTTQNQNTASPSNVGTNITVNDTADATVVTGVAAKVAPSVVTLLVSGESESGSGSGIVLTEDGYILTNAHVATLEGATSDPKITVQTYDGRLFSATIVGSDPIADIAVVKVDADGVTFQPAEFADSAKLNVGDTAIAIGAPLGLSNTVTSGVVSALNRSITVASSAIPESEDATPDQGQGGSGPFDFWEFDNGQEKDDNAPVSSTISLPVIQTDAAINPGNSGGALLDEDGKVMGVNVAIATAGSSSAAGSIGVGFAIPANYAKRIATEIIENGEATHGLLGATVQDVTNNESVKNPTVVGAAIYQISSGGAAEKAGLKQGDIVTKFNGVPITGMIDLTAQVRVLAAGSTAELSYVRDGTSYTATVTLGEL